MSCPKELLSEATQTVLAHLERLKTMLRSQRGKGSCVACILALIPTDVPALTALRTTLLSRKQRNRLMPRLLAWVDGWLDTLLEEVRPRSALDARAVMRDRSKLRRARQGVGGELRKRERQRRKSNGHWKGRRESDDYDDWEGEVVQA
ncbi:hypothetical protein MMC08_006160, partial [Hypocenomyce scalaris]|nr:hypothetical protein [Hypocenomyce scalaris]